jgi:uncharacterized protein (TIGR02147 family)
MDMDPLKGLFGYIDYRKFLKDVYDTKKAQNPGFSFRVFSRIAGFSSPNFLKLVMENKRNLSRVGARKIAQGLKLNQDAAKFFENLVQFNQATTAGEKERFARELMSSRSYRRSHPLNESQFNYFANWYYIPIRELASLEGFREDPRWIAAQILPPIQPHEAKKALHELFKLGILKRNKDRKIELAALNITTGDEVTQSSVAHYHREMLKRAAESIDLIPRENRDISAITMGMSIHTAHKIKEKIQEFRRDIVDLVSQDEDPNTVYQLNFQLFPLARVLDTGEKK